MIVSEVSSLFDDELHYWQMLRAHKLYVVLQALFSPCFNSDFFVYSLFVMLL